MDAFCLQKATHPPDKVCHWGVKFCSRTALGLAFQYAQILAGIDLETQIICFCARMIPTFAVLALVQKESHRRHF